MPKKAGATKCEQYRTISLMSHLTKLIIRVLLKRIRGRTADDVAEEQYGFMPDKGTRNVIVLIPNSPRAEGCREAANCRYCF